MGHLFLLGRVVLSVTLLATPLFGQTEGRPLHLASEVRLATGVGPADTTFLIAADGVLGPNEEIYLVDPTAPGVYVYDARGRFIRRLGRPGDGPGEFRSAMAAGWLYDTLWVADYQLRRVSLFTEAGDFIRVLQQPVPGVLRMLADGGFVVARVDPASLYEGTASTDPLVRFPPADTAPDTVALLVHSPPARIKIGSEGQRQFQQFFADGHLWAVSPGGRTIVVVDRRVPGGPEDAAFTISTFGMDGGRTATARVGYVPRRLDDRIYAATVGRFVDDLDAQGRLHMRREQFAVALRAATLRPRFLPPVTRLVVATDGRVWLRREDLAEDDVTWQVFSADGQVRGTVRLPTEEEVFAVSSRSVLVGRHFDDGHMEVTRYRYQ